MNSAAEVRAFVLQGVIRRKMARLVRTPLVVDGIQYQLRGPSFEDAARAWIESKEDEIKQRAILVVRFLERYGERVFEDGDADVLLMDDPKNAILTHCDPILKDWLSTKAPKKDEAPGAHPAFESALDLDIELSAGSCRICEIAVDRDCYHRKGQILIRCAVEPCSHYVRAAGQQCAVHEYSTPRST